MNDNTELDKLRQAAEDARARAERWPTPTLDEQISEDDLRARAADYAAAWAALTAWERASVEEARRDIASG